MNRDVSSLKSFLNMHFAIKKFKAQTCLYQLLISLRCYPMARSYDVWSCSREQFQAHMKLIISVRGKRTGRREEK